MGKSKVQEILAGLSNVKTLNSVGDNVIFYDTGVLMLNFMLSGSIFKGLPSKLSTVAGFYASGKSFMTYTIAHNFLKEHENGIFIMYETEGAVDTKKLRNFISQEFGNRFVYYGPDDDIPVLETFIAHINQKLDEIEAVKEKFGDEAKFIIAVDSLAGFVSKQVVEMMKNNDLHANWITFQLLKTNFKLISGRIDKLKIPMFATTHVSPNVMGGMYQKKTTILGGSGMQFFCRNLFEISKVTNKEDREGGMTARTSPDKALYVSPNFKVDFDIFYKRSMDVLSGFVPFICERGWATRRAGIIKGVDELEGMKFDVTEVTSDNYKEVIGMKYLTKIDEMLQEEYLLGNSNNVKDDEDEDETNIEDMTASELQEYILHNGYMTEKQLNKYTDGMNKKEMRKALREYIIESDESESED
jgi:hypothetical protein